MRRSEWNLLQPWLVIGNSGRPEYQPNDQHTLQHRAGSVPDNYHRKYQQSESQSLVRGGHLGPCATALGHSKHDHNRNPDRYPDSDDYDHVSWLDDHHQHSSDSSGRSSERRSAVGILFVLVACDGYLSHRMAGAAYRDCEWERCGEGMVSIRQ